jgi:hypothetical protein
LYPSRELKLAVAEKCPALVNRKSIIFHQDIAGPHVVIMMQEKLRELKWENLSHMPCSPGLAPEPFGWKKIQNIWRSKKSHQNLLQFQAL